MYPAPSRNIEKKLIRLLLFMTVFVPGAIGSFLFIIWTIVVNNEERKSFLASLNLIRSSLYSLEEELVASYKEWVNYDNPILYVQGKYPDFVEKEIYGSLHTLKINFFASYYPDGNLKEIHFFRNGIVEKTPEDLKNFFSNFKLKNFSSRDQYLSGFVKIGSEFYFIAAVGLFWFGDNYEKSHGIFVFGRNLKDFIKSNVTIVSSEIINISSIDKDFTGKDIVIKNSPFSVKITGNIVLEDLQKKPSILISIEKDKEFYILYLKSIGISIFIGGIFWLITFKITENYVRKNISQRLLSFNQEILKIAEDLENPKHVPISEIDEKNKDEIYSLKKTFNTLITRIIDFQEINANVMSILQMQKNRAIKFIENVLPKKYVPNFEHEFDFLNTEEYPEVSILFADIVNYTKISFELTPSEIISILNDFYSEIDYIVEKYNIEKIKTIGDCYMASSGLPDPDEFHADNMILAAIEILAVSKRFSQEVLKGFSVRIGINSGKVIGGIIGRNKFLFDLWGETVNIASRIESYGVPDHIQISESTYNAIKNPYLRNIFKRRGSIILKGGRKIVTYISHDFENIKNVITENFHIQT